VRFLDTNIFLRYLLGDIPDKSLACLDLFEAIEDGREQATTCEAVITEIVYVLRSTKLYGWVPGEIRDMLQPVLSLPGLHIQYRDVYLQALDLIVDHPFLDMEDAICKAHMDRLGISEIYSYDKHFDRVAGVQRVIPGSD
jgi:predicted nucleic acid-binding protein